MQRFVGDLNPEAVIRERLDGPSSKPLRDRIGLWISSAGQDDIDGDENAYGRQQRQPSGIEIPFTAGLSSQQPIAAFLQQRYAAALQTCERLPLPTRDRLIPIYFSRVNHILPFLDKDLFLKAHSDGTASVFLERALCLVAAKDQAAGSALRLTIDGPVLSSRQFCTEIYRGLAVAMNAGLESDRITGIRILALMSLHCEGYEGAEAASMNICQAIHQAQTAGLHLNRPGRAPGDSLSKLFWCLWTLDKMHASIGGRPIILADRDIGIEKPDLKTSAPRSAFDVWLVISDLLSMVISFYRPSADHNVGWEDNFPTFEQIVGDHMRDDLDFTTLGALPFSGMPGAQMTNNVTGILELYYHAVGILSCRPKLSDRSDGLEPSYVRQGLAAVRINSIVASECSQDLPPLPVVPYALSLSMGVSYQQFRSSKLITHFDRAKRGLEACCALLEGFGTYWYSAEAMARLGRKALHHIEGLKPETRGHGFESEKQTSAGKVSDFTVPASAPAMAWPSYHHPNDLTSSGEVAPREDLATTSAQDISPLESLDVGGPDVPGNDSFADIDMLFGDFLDLSLPTNFWDPVFFTEEGHSDGAV